MAEVGLLPFARTDLEVAIAVLPLYRSRFSKHQFTQPQLLLAEIGPIHRFASKRQLYSYAGLTPRLRWILVEAATVAARHSPAAQRYYQPLAERKHRNVARVALARKLPGAVWALLQHGVCFDAQVFAAM